MQDKTCSWREEKRVTEQSKRGNMDLLVLGRVLLSSQDTFLSSTIMYYGAQAGPLLVLHVSRASIMGTAVQLLPHLHTRSTLAHPHNLSHAPSHTNTAFRVKAEAKKMSGANNHPSGLQNSNRGNAELKCIKNLQYLQSLWVHRQSAITGSTASSVSAAELHNKSVPLLYWAYRSHNGILVQIAGLLWNFEKHYAVDCTVFSLVWA